MSRPSTTLLHVLAITLVVALIGVYATYSTYRNTRQELVTKFTILAESAALGIDPDDFSELTNTAADKNNSGYLKLRQQLLSVGQILKKEHARWFYTTVYKNGQIWFSVDGIPEDDPGYNEPGVDNLYQDPPPELAQVFFKDQIAITKPYTDEWGNFVSFFVPVHSRQSSDIVAVLGLDVDYSSWQTLLWNKTLTTGFLFILLWFIGIIVYFAFFGRYRRALALQQSQQTLSAIMASTHEPIILANSSGLIEAWNQAAENLFGYTYDEVLHQPLTRFINLAELAANCTPEVVQHRELEIVVKDNRKVTAEIFARHVVIKDQQFCLFTLRDVTEHKLIEAELTSRSTELDDSRLAVLNVLEDVEEEKAQTDALISGIADGIIAVDRDLRIIYMNQAAENMLGLKAVNLVGKVYYKYIRISDHNDKSLSSSQRPFTVAVKTGRPVTTSTIKPYYYQRADKTKFPVAINVSPVILNDQVIGSINVFRDITHDLEVDKMKTEFISLASHQLRTPLSATKWFADMLLKGDVGKLLKDQQDFVQNIYDSNERMIELVNSLLNISRIESGRLMINPAPTKLSELVKDVVSDVKAKLDQKQQNLIISLHPQLPIVNLDKSLIRQVYLNLLTNAIKYTPPNGDISITISKDKDNIVTQVSDTGYGIPTKDNHKVFQKFFRADNIIKHETDGTGLGLYLTKAVVESSGGTIWFKSEEGKGTSFWFTLPIAGVAPRPGEVTLDS